MELGALTEEQKKEIDELWQKMVLVGDLPFGIVEREDYFAIYATNPHVIKAIVLEAIVSLIKRGSK